MKKTTFRKIIWANLILAILVVIKIVFYPYSLAPADLAKAMILYEELQPLADTFVIIMIFWMGIFPNTFLDYSKISIKHLSENKKEYRLEISQKKREFLQIGVRSEF